MYPKANWLTLLLAVALVATIALVVVNHPSPASTPQVTVSASYQHSSKLAAVHAARARAERNLEIATLERSIDRLRARLHATRHSLIKWKKSRHEQHHRLMVALRKLHRLHQRIGGSVSPSQSYYGSDRGAAVVRLAQQFVGHTWYVWGGSSHSGTDCSGLVLHVYAEVGIRLYHGATAQQRASRAIPLSQLRPGDLVFYGSSYYSHHVAIYVGGGRTIEAPYTGALVRYGYVGNAWIGGTFFH